MRWKSCHLMSVPDTSDSGFRGIDAISPWRTLCCVPRCSRYCEQSPSSWRFIKTNHGKPILDPPSFGFNLSHTKGLVACVVAIGRDVGIDVERVDPTSEIDPSWASHFSRSEVEQLAACSADVRQRALLRPWTLKEAYGKAIGLGLGNPLDSTTFDLASPGTIGFTNCSGEADRARSENLRR